MSALAEQIAREHPALLNTSTWLIVGCTCDPTLTAPPSGAAGSWYAAHIATVTERAVRERVATDERRRLAAALRAKFGVTNRAADYIARLPDGWADQWKAANGAPDA